MCEMLCYIYKSKDITARYIFEIFNEMEDRKPNTQILIDYDLTDIKVFRDFNEIINYIIDTREVCKNTKSTFTLPDDKKIERRTYYYFDGLNMDIKK